MRKAWEQVEPTGSMTWPYFASNPAEGGHRYREMFDALPAAIYTTDAQGRVTYFNPACIEFSGRMPTLSSDQWCVTWKLYHPDGTPMPHDTCPMAIALKEGRMIRGAEAIAERPDGTRVWFMPHPTPLRDANGKIIGGINMLVDITQRKQAELAQAKLAAIVESSDDAIISKNLNSIIMSWNRGAERIFGYSAEEAIGKSVTMLMPPDRVNEEPGILERIRLGASIDHYETVRRRKDGTLIDVSLTVSPMRDARGQIVGASKIARDITARKRHEEALRQSEQRLQRVLETDAVAVLFFNYQGILIGANDVFLHMTGYRRQQIDRRELTWRTMTPPEWVDISQKQMEQFARTGRIGPYEKEYLLADGTRRWMLFAGRDLGDGTIAEYCIDINESKRREADSRALAALGSQMITADEPQAIHEKIVDAAVGVMRSDFASMQLFHPDRGEAGELQLLAHRGFDPEGVKFWQWVSANSTCVCGLTLRAGTRVVIPDAAHCDLLDEGQKKAYQDAGIRAMQSTPLISRSGKLLGMISTHWRYTYQPKESELSNFDILARQAADVLERSQAERAIRQNEAWLAAQKEALQSALDGEPLEHSLEVLVRGAIDRFGPGTRTAFYRASDDGTTLHHIVGMGPEYAEIIDGLKISPESFSCALAAHTRRPILTSDVKDEPRWQPWLGVAEQFNFRGCWSFPLHTPSGERLGTFAVYWREPRRATERDVAFASAVADTAAIIISRHNEARVRLEAQIALRESEQQLSAMFAQAGVGVVLIQTDDYRMLRVNPAFSQIVGYSERELIGKSCLDMTHPDDRPEIVRRFKEMETTGQRTTTIEKRYVKKDGRPVWVRVNLAKLADRDRNRSVAMIEDITEQRLAAANLARAKEEAEAANIAKDNFLATLSHELRTPLTPVLATLSSWEALRSFPKELAEDLEVVRRNVDLEARLIDDLLDLTRIAKGKIALNFEVLNVQKVLDAVIAMYLSEIRAKRIDLSVHPDGSDCHIRSDPGRLQQAFWNILKNAVKFTPEGGKIDITVRNDQHGRVEIIFTDNGVGISPAMLSRLFQPFEQETAGLYGGLGLGLAITKKLLEVQQGTIEARSDGRGTGASFIITLPTVERQPIGGGSSSPAKRQSERSPAAGYRVLLVEDHIDTARVLARLLGVNGHTVTTSHTITEALNFLRNQDFDILLSDIGLPDGTGIDFIRAVRRELRKNTPAVALTGFGMEEDVTRTIQAGFNDHLTKPVNLARLEQTIRRACNGGNPVESALTSK